MRLPDTTLLQHQTQDHVSNFMRTVLKQRTKTRIKICNQIGESRVRRGGVGEKRGREGQRQREAVTAWGLADVSVYFHRKRGTASGRAENEFDGAGRA